MTRRSGGRGRWRLGQTGPGGPPLGLGLNEGLGVTRAATRLSLRLAEWFRNVLMKNFPAAASFAQAECSANSILKSFAIRQRTSTLEEPVCICDFWTCGYLDVFQFELHIALRIGLPFIPACPICSC